MLNFLAIFLLKVICAYPGALVRWAFGGFRKPYKYYLERDYVVISFIGILFMIILFVIGHKIIVLI